MTMMELMQKGGPMMWVILVASIAATAVFLKKAFDLHRAQIKWSDFLRGIYNILKRRNIVEAVSICEETPGPVASLVRAAVLHYDEDRETIRRAIEEAGLVKIPRLERNLGMLATLAQTAPLMGVLGTILGMIQMMLAVQQRAPLVQAGDLMGGMMQALIASAAGLAVGILAYGGYNFLVSRVETVVLDMEMAAADILSYLTRRGRESERRSE